jgi:hypothetical protein
MDDDKIEREKIRPPDGRKLEGDRRPPLLLVKGFWKCNNITASKHKSFVG